MMKTNMLFHIVVADNVVVVVFVFFFFFFFVVLFVFFVMIIMMTLLYRCCCCCYCYCWQMLNYDEHKIDFFFLGNCLLCFFSSFALLSLSLSLLCIYLLLKFHQLVVLLLLLLLMFFKSFAVVVVNIQQIDNLLAVMAFHYFKFV